MFNLRSLWSGPRTVDRAISPPKVHLFRPMLEGFEDRTVPHAPALGPAAEAPAVTPAQIADLITITDIDLTDLQIVDGVLTAAGTVTGTLAGLPFTADITDFALQLVEDDPETPGTECAILDLALGPIDIDLLGLHVDTSAICLEVTAIEGGGLLGDLLCGIAGDLPLGLGGLDLDGLTGALQQIIGGVLGQELGNAGPAQAGAEDICDGECEVLDLALGPIDLTLLGLNVYLHNCEDGPVQVCVSASAGQGLLGDLLCGLSGRPLFNLDLGDITQIGSRATELFADGDISGRDGGELTSLVNQLRR
jgi:hypothetical protein